MTEVLIPPEVPTRNTRLLVDKRGNLSAEVQVRLIDSTSFLATSINDPIVSTEEPGLPFHHFFPQFISFNRRNGGEILVPISSISRIERSTLK